MSMLVELLLVTLSALDEGVDEAVDFVLVVSDEADCHYAKVDAFYSGAERYA